MRSFFFKQIKKERRSFFLRNGGSIYIWSKHVEYVFSLFSISLQISFAASLKIKVDVNKKLHTTTVC